MPESKWKSKKSAPIQLLQLYVILGLSPRPITTLVTFFYTRECFFCTDSIKKITRYLIITRSQSYLISYRKQKLQVRSCRKTHIRSKGRRTSGVDKWEHSEICTYTPITGLGAVNICACVMIVPSLYLFLKLEIKLGPVSHGDPWLWYARHPPMPPNQLSLPGCLY